MTALPMAENRWRPSAAAAFTAAAIGDDQAAGTWSWWPSSVITSTSSPSWSKTRALNALDAGDRPTDGARAAVRTQPSRSRSPSFQRGPRGAGGAAAADVAQRAGGGAIAPARRSGRSADEARPVAVPSRYHVPARYGPMQRLAGVDHADHGGAKFAHTAKAPPPARWRRPALRPPVPRHAPGRTGAARSG